MSEKPKVVIVVGATASGKSAVGVSLAKAFSGEIISADSRQVYRGLDIGTAKMTDSEMQGIPHHLIDIVEPNTPYTAADFKRDAKTKIDEIILRKKTPIIVGGTFFYIDILLERVTLPEVPPNPTLRAYLEDLSTETLHHRLEELDPERAFSIDRNNKRRLVRALEIVDAIGKVPNTNETDSPYSALLIGLKCSREDLRERFHARGEEWLKRGFKNEVESLLSQGVSRDRLHEIGFEYQLMLEHIDGQLDEHSFLERFVEKNWQYAKRQMTWLKRDHSIEWFSPADYPEVEKRVATFLSTL